MWNISIKTWREETIGENLFVEGRILLKEITKKLSVRNGLNSDNSEYDPMVCFCENSIGQSGSP